jgi:isoquinoline 1-oxidoreductase beta subunit
VLQGRGRPRRLVGWGRHDAARAAAPAAAEGARPGRSRRTTSSASAPTTSSPIVCKHHEMGQGNTTGLASMVADELDADWALVRTEYAPSDPKRYANLMFGDLQGTGGSSAISNSFLQYRNAGATARAMLVAAAADAWKVPASEVRTAKGVLTHASGKRATYGEMAEAASRVKLAATRR